MTETVYHVRLGPYAARITLAVHWDTPPLTSADWPAALDLPRCLVTLGLPSEPAGVQARLARGLTLRGSGRVFQEALYPDWGENHPTECLRTCSVLLPTAEPSVSAALSAGRAYAAEQLAPLISHFERRAERLLTRELTMARAKAL